MDEILVLHGFEEAEIGICTTWHGEQLVERVVYDANAMIHILVEKEGISAEEAADFIEAEFIFKYAGDTQPVIVWVSAETDENQ